MVTGLTYIFTSITLSILLPYLLKGDGHDRVGETTIYRYPKNVSLFFLYAAPVFACVTAFIYSTFPTGEPSGTGLFGFGFFALCVIVLPTIAYLYFNSYRIQVDNQALTFVTFFGTTIVDLRLIAQIATFEGKGRDLWLYDRQGICLLKIGGSLQDFGSLLFDLERQTRSPSVILYKGDELNGWQEKTNEEHGYWRPSKGPKPVRKLNKYVVFFLAFGLASIALIYWVTHVYLK